jgi:hypothetical protein
MTWCVLLPPIEPRTRNIAFLALSMSATQPMSILLKQPLQQRAPRRKMALPEHPGRLHRRWRRRKEQEPHRVLVLSFLAGLPFYGRMTLLHLT